MQTCKKLHWLTGWLTGWVRKPVMGTVQHVHQPFNYCKLLKHNQWSETIETSLRKRSSLLSWSCDVSTRAMMALQLCHTGQLVQQGTARRIVLTFFVLGLYWGPVSFSKPNGFTRSAHAGSCRHCQTELKPDETRRRQRDALPGQDPNRTKQRLTQTEAEDDDRADRENKMNKWEILGVKSRT